MTCASREVSKSVEYGPLKFQGKLLLQRGYSEWEGEATRPSPVTVDVPFYTIWTWEKIWSVQNSIDELPNISFHVLSDFRCSMSTRAINILSILILQKKRIWHPQNENIYLLYGRNLSVTGRKLCYVYVNDSIASELHYQAIYYVTTLQLYVHSGISLYLDKFLWSLTF